MVVSENDGIPITQTVVCLTGMPSFSDTTDISSIGYSFKTNSRRTPLFHVTQYGDDVIGQELHLNIARELSARLFLTNHANRLPPSSSLTMFTMFTVQKYYPD